MSRRREWRERLLPLVDHPREWHQVHVYDSPLTAYSVTYQLRQGRMKPPPGRWAFTVRTEDGRGAVYARYLPPRRRR